MKAWKTSYWVIFILFLLSIFGCTAVSGIHNVRKKGKIETLEKANSLTFMTFNIRAGGGSENPSISPYDVASSREKLQRIASAIKSVDPDVIALQEVRGYNQAKFIAETLNLNYAYIEHPHVWGSWWGLAILSKFKIIDAVGKTIYFGDRGRIGLLADIDIYGDLISFINVHYHLGSYEQQVNATMKLISEASYPVVLMGDLNRKPYHTEIFPIKEKLVDTCWEVKTEGAKQAENRGTWYPGSGKRYVYSPSNRIDYIFVDPKFLKVRDVGLILREYWNVSDHIAYFSKVTLKK